MVIVASATHHLMGPGFVVTLLLAENSPGVFVLYIASDMNKDYIRCVRAECAVTFEVRLRDVVILIFFSVSTIGVSKIDLNCASRAEK